VPRRVPASAAPRPCRPPAGATSCSQCRWPRSEASLHHTDSRPASSQLGSDPAIAVTISLTMRRSAVLLLSLASFALAADTDPMIRKLDDLAPRYGQMS